MKKETIIKRISKMNFGGIPYELWKDPEIHDAVVQAGSRSAFYFSRTAKQYMPKDVYALYMDDLIMPLMRESPQMIEYIPDEVITAEMCALAVGYDGDLIVNIPEKYRTKQIYEEAAKNFHYKGTVKYLPAEVLSEDMLKRLITKTKGDGLEFVPKEKKTYDLCLLAVSLGGKNLRYVPFNIRDEALCIMAVENDKDAFGYVPQKFRKKEICEKMVAKNPHVIEKMPENCISMKACRAAAEKDKSLVRYMPEKLLAKALLAYSEQGVS